MMLRIVMSMFVGMAVVSFTQQTTVRGCCAVSKAGTEVLNADQSVVILWDAAAKTQHFIRKASFTSEADNIGFLVPTPSQPQLAESDDGVFSFLREKTKPEYRYVFEFGPSCDKSKKDIRSAVEVLDEKRVAGFDAVVLKSESAAALVDWLREHGYVYSPAVEAWAKPYLESGWLITALKIAREDKSQRLTAKALRLSFRTEQPLFPYREPDYGETKAEASRTRKERDAGRLLRIYFIAESRYKADVAAGNYWAGRVAWSNRLSDIERVKTLELLQLPADTAPAQWWLTEFEGDWPYVLADKDILFSPGNDSTPIGRPPIQRVIQYGGFVAFLLLIAGTWLLVKLIRWIVYLTEGSSPAGK